MSMIPFLLFSRTTQKKFFPLIFLPFLPNWNVGTTMRVANGKLNTVSYIFTQKPQKVIVIIKFPFPPFTFTFSVIFIIIIIQYFLLHKIHFSLFLIPISFRWQNFEGVGRVESIVEKMCMKYEYSHNYFKRFPSTFYSSLLKCNTMD